MKLGIIGGSGIYDIENMEHTGEHHISTPFGMPSAPLRTGRLEGREIVFLPRHGDGHIIPPHKVNYRANIWALKSLGVTHVLAVSAVGSMKEEIRPGDFVVVDQFIDMTRRRDTTFYDDLAVHVVYADPVCASMHSLVARETEKLGITVHRHGTYVNIEGPQFSTRAESRWYRMLGVDVIGMTNATEARLAREAELHFVTLALATDYDCWHESEDDVSVEQVIEVLNRNSANAKKVVQAVARTIDTVSCDVCNHALDGAVMTDLGRLSQVQREKYRLLLERFYG